MENVFGVHAFGLQRLAARAVIRVGPSPARASIDQELYWLPLLSKGQRRRAEIVLVILYGPCRRRTVLDSDLGQTLEIDLTLRNIALFRDPVVI